MEGNENNNIENKIMPISKTRLSLFTVIVFLLGMLTYFFIDPLLPLAGSNTKKGYEAGNISGYKTGFDAAKKIAEDSYLGKLFKAQPVDIHSISGVIVSKQNNTFVLRDERMKSPFEENNLQNRTVIVSASTSEVFILSMDNSRQSDEKLKSVLLKMATSSVSSVSPYIKTKSNFSGLVVGDKVTVFSKEDIQNLEKFEAQEVQVAPKITIK